MEKYYQQIQDTNQDFYNQESIDSLETIAKYQASIHNLHYKKLGYAMYQDHEYAYYQIKNENNDNRFVFRYDKHDKVYTEYIVVNGKTLDTENYPIMAKYHVGLNSVREFFIQYLEKLIAMIK